MKYIYLSVFASLLVASCQKSTDTRTVESCSKMQADYFQDGIQYNTGKYEYDNQQRVTQIIFGNRVTTFTYYTDSVVVTDMGYRTTYMLDARGLATSGYLVNVPNTAGSRTDYTYTYNLAGYLIAERTINTQIHLGNTLRDTVQYTYTVENGNITRRLGTNGVDHRYSYSKLPLQNNIFELNPFMSSRGAYFGKTPTNIPSRLEFLPGTVAENYTYTTGANNRVTEKTVIRNSPGFVPVKIALSYTCN